MQIHLLPVSRITFYMETHVWYIPAYADVSLFRSIREDAEVQ